MINNAGSLETITMTVEERLGALIASCNCNNRELQKGINELCDTVKVHDDVIADCLADISELFTKNKKKAGKFGLILMGVAGLAYIIKNEIDKDKMRTKLIQLDKDARGCEQFAYTPTEDEGEAEPIGI